MRQRCTFCAPKIRIWLTWISLVRGHLRLPLAEIIRLESCAKFVKHGGLLRTLQDSLLVLPVESSA